MGMFLTLLPWIMIHVSHEKVKMKKTPGDGILATDDLCFFLKKKGNKHKIKDDASSWRTSKILYTECVTGT